MKIGIVGMGYVGIVGGVCLARSGHNVIGMDVDKNKVSYLKSGNLPIYENKLEGYFNKVTALGFLNFTDNLNELVENSDICFVCVGTPTDENGNINLRYVEDVSIKMGEELRKINRFYVVVFRSTIECGTSEKLIISNLEKYSGKKVGVDFGYGFNPEFLREGTAVEDFYDPPRTVISATDENTLNIIKKVYDDISGEKIVLPILEAEIVKYADNIWHATKITFANEIGRITKKLGGDGRMVMDSFCKDTKLNISSTYLKPGFAFGGSCLPKDIRAFLQIASKNNIESPLISSLMKSNMENLTYSYELISSKINKKDTTSLIGIAFKPGTDDVRESPALYLAEYFINKGYNIKFLDPYVSQSAVLKYFENKGVKTENIDFYETFEETLKNSQNLIFSGSFKDIYYKESDYAGKRIFDLNGVLYNLNGMEGYYGIAW